MSDVNVIFAGICTHITGMRMPALGDALASPASGQPPRFTRTVLVHGSGRRIGDRGIPPHQAVLWIPKEFVEKVPKKTPGLELLDPEVMTWRMNGVRLYLANAQADSTRTTSFDKVPSLTAYAGRLSLDLDPRVVCEGRAAAVFDLFAGSFDAFQGKAPYDAVCATVRVSVADVNPELVIVSIWDQKKSRIRLKNSSSGGLLTPPNVLVLNTGVDRDSELDFRLHYDVTTWSPGADQLASPKNLQGIRKATSDEQELLEKGIPGGLSIACSNSNWP